MGKKRKKEDLHQAKKIKHKHTKVKLHVLKYYKVDEAGKIRRLRKECPRRSVVLESSWRNTLTATTVAGAS